MALGILVLGCGGGDKIDLVFENDQGKLEVSNQKIRIVDKETGDVIEASGGIPEDFPDSFVYPNAKSHSMGMQLSEKVVSLLTLTADPPNKVFEFYRNLAGEDGFKIESSATINDQSMMNAVKGEEMLMLVVGRAEDGVTQVQITFTYGEIQEMTSP